MTPRWAWSGRGLGVAIWLLAVACHGGSDEPVPTLQLGEPTISGRVAMTLYDDLGRPSVWLVDADGQNLQSVESAGSATTQPRFARDGTRLAYVSYARGLCVLDLVSNTTQDVATDGSRPTWSPTGDRLAWVDSAERIHVRELATGATTVVWQSPDHVESIDWSPTQDVLAIAWEGRGQVSPFGLDLGLLPVGGGEPRTIGGWFFDVRWSPDGRMLGAAGGLIDVRGRAVIGGERLSPWAWSGDGKGQVRLATVANRQHVALLDLQGQVRSILPMPPDLHLPVFFDYGSLWADWSWE